MNLKPEQVLHINFVNWFKFTYEDYIEDIIHIANERKTSWVEGHLLKRMGVKRGVPDIFISVPYNGKHGLWLELKANGNKISKEQQSFLKRKELQGYACGVGHSLEEAQNIVDEYFSFNNTILEFNSKE